MKIETENRRLTIYDCTLRDGAQTTGVHFSVQDKINIASKLDKLGFPYIEGGFANSNDIIDRTFFEYMGKHPLERAALTAFGMTRRKGVRADQDAGLKELLQTGTEVVTIVGKGSKEHAVETLGVGLEENIDMIGESIEYLRREGREVIFDVEHYYYGFRENRQASLRIIAAAKQAGASTIVLCDTAAGIMPWKVGSATRAARKHLGNDVILGIHVHNDTGIANSATLEAVLAGATHVQGTINGLGERTGNLDLCQWLPTAILLNGFEFPGFDVAQIRSLSKLVEAVSGIKVPPNTPFVGDNAFKHKAGMHADAICKKPNAYHPIDPSLVGATVSFEHSDQGGGANVLAMAEKFGYQLDKKNPKVKELVKLMKEARVLGDAQQFLILRNVLLDLPDPFDILSGTRVISSVGSQPVAMVKICVNGDVYHEASTGKGTLHAFDEAMKKALRAKYPEVDEIKLTNYRVIVPVNRTLGTDETVIVEMEFGFNGHRWTSKVMSADEASANNKALIDGYKYWILQRR